MKITTIAIMAACLTIGYLGGAGSVYYEAIQNDAAHYHPKQLGIVWGPSTSIGISINDLAMPDEKVKKVKK
jgi:hypothetical protein